MNLSDLQRHWDAFGRQDPMWAILTDPARKGRRWTPDAFFATGVAEIEAHMAEAAALGLPVQRRSALDFGCGLGRLTQALAAHADQVLGLDVAPSMVEQACAFNRHGARVDYRVQAAPPLGAIADRSIDLVYTGRVLQHIAPEYARRYISELARVLAPGGFLSFDVPSRPLDAPALPAGALAPSAYRAALAVTRQALTPDGARIELDVLVTNMSDQPWPAGAPLNLGNHWLTAEGEMVVPDDQRAALPLPLGAGQSVSVSMAASLPENPAAQVLELDLVHEGVAWFAWLDSPTVRLPLNEPAGPPGLVPAADESAVAAVVAVAAEPAFEPVMEMHAVPREAVERLLDAAGVRLLRVRREHHCGPRWDAFRYDVTAG